jgi:SWI/SNF-related matrix-associated actin-dependent regulator 1 of chromatin subfamily A
LILNYLLINISEGEEHHENDYNKSDLKQMARGIIRKCENTITNLRAALNEWAGDENEKVDSENGTASIKNNCVGLLKISDKVAKSSNSKILNDSDIKKLCPGLELKDYQLVGVNWLRLLHLNKINGVLADDMVNYYLII